MLGNLKEGGLTLPYDLMNPVVMTMDEAIINPVLNVKAALHIDEIPALDGSDPILTSIDHIIASCQQSKKASFSICKNGQHVVQLTLPRTHFRLGENIAVFYAFSESVLPCFHVILVDFDYG